MHSTASIKFFGISVLAALFTVMASLPANAKARGASKAQKEIMAIKWNCDTQNLAKLDQLIKKGAKRKLGKKDLDRARYRHDFAKRVLGEKDKALCLAALQSGARVLAFAKQKRAPYRSCPDVMKNLPNMIARGDEANAPAKKLFDAEVEYTRAQKALKLKGKTNASVRNTRCLKHADAANKTMAEVEKWIEAGIKANLAARKRCPYGDSRSCGSWRSKAKWFKRLGPSDWLVCNTKGIAALQAKIERWRKNPKAPTNVAKKALADAKKHRAARQWPKCMARLDAGKTAFKQVESEHKAAERAAKKKWKMDEAKRLCNAGRRRACSYVNGENPFYKLPGSR